MKVKYKPTQVGDTRYQIKFAWFTKYLGRKDEQGYELGVWWERYVVVEMYLDGPLEHYGVSFETAHWSEVYVYTWDEWIKLVGKSGRPKEIEADLKDIPWGTPPLCRGKEFLGIKVK